MGGGFATLTEEKREQLQEAARLDAVKKEPDEFRQWLADAEADAAALEQVLRQKAKGRLDAQAADMRFGASERTDSCPLCGAPGPLRVRPG